MDAENLLQYAGGLLKSALSKTHSIDEAQDLVQETYLQTLVALSKGVVIENPKAYLSSVLYNRFFLNLRNKYKVRTVSYDALPQELSDDNDDFERIFKTDEAGMIRRELAFLSYIYRETMVRYYMQNQSVADIAKALGVPTGTVLSRLDVGRKKIKEGVEHMENYNKNSYQPEKLTIGINGRTGLNNEPFSCVKNSMDQNILILAYEKPVTSEELSRALGVPMPFIEESVEQLVSCELLKREGRRVFTDFVIISLADSQKSLDNSKQFAKDTLDDANPAFMQMVAEYEKIEGFSKCDATYLYILAIFSCQQNYAARIADALSDGLDEFEAYPDRPNYGKWIAVGSRYPHGFNFNDERNKYNASGRSTTGVISDTIINACEWDIPIGYTHNARFKYDLKQSERVLAIDAIRTNSVSAFQSELIPDFEKLGFIKTENGKKVPAVPYIKKSDEGRFFEIERIGSDIWCKKLLDKATAVAKENILKYPKRIKHVINIIYNDSLFYLQMAYVYEAAARGFITLDKDKRYPIMYIVAK